MTLSALAHGISELPAEMLPREDRVRIDLPIDDLLRLAAVADLGFKRMMLNDRRIQTLRFADEEQAW